MERIENNPIEAIAWHTGTIADAQNRIEEIKDKVYEDFHSDHDHDNEACEVCVAYKEIFGEPEKDNDDVGD